MFKIKGRNIEVTRGDMLPIVVTNLNKDKTNYVFKVGDIIRFKVFQKANVKNVVLSKDFEVVEETIAVDVLLTSADTKIGDLIDEPTEYWYEIELNPDTDYTNTILGYSKEEGAALFWLLPEGGDKQ